MDLQVQMVMQEKVSQQKNKEQDAQRKAEAKEAAKVVEEEVTRKEESWRKKRGSKSYHSPMEILMVPGPNEEGSSGLWRWDHHSQGQR